LFSARTSREVHARILNGLHEWNVDALTKSSVHLHMGMHMRGSMLFTVSPISAISCTAISA
jgi:hypothetical protein